MRFAITDRQPLPQGRAPARPLFAIGDIHGHSDALAALLGHLIDVIDQEHDGREVDLVYLGDYVDRGPDPRGVLELVSRGVGFENVVETALMGNHDWFLYAAAQIDGEQLSLQDWAVWLGNGGKETLESLGGLGYRTATAEKVREALGEEAVGQLGKLEMRFASGQVLCVHAGVNPEVSLDKQTRDDMLWIRGPFLRAAERGGVWRPGVTVVHGHTPNAYGVYPHRIGVDTGGFATGVFTAVEITEEGVRFHHFDRSSAA